MRTTQLASLIFLVLLETFAASSVGLAQNSASLPVAAPAASTALPRVEQKNGHFALIVDGKPFLMLGVQANNSSAWPQYLGRVWPAAEALHANTVELPIYWEQFEPRPNEYDYSLVDQILTESREHHLRLVLVWFGTWKNASSHYTPEWMKTDQKKYPFVLDKNGQTVDSPSVYSPARLEADKNAFRALMSHLKTKDPQHTVLLVQVENEAGVWGSVRDFGPEANQAITGEVPAGIVKKLGKKPGTWHEVFGEDADEYFQGWCTASYIEQVAAAGKAVYPLPLYVNAALRDPFQPGKPPSYESGSPTDNEIDLWKAAAPSIDIIAPDIYLPEYSKYTRVMDLYGRADNPLLIPETGNSADYARYIYAAVGHGAIGWAPFGLDYTRYSNHLEGPEAMEPEALKPFSRQIGLLAPISDLLAKANLDGRLRGSSEDPDHHAATLAFEHWKVQLEYGMPPFGMGMEPKGNHPADGGALVVQLTPDEFLLAGHHVRVDFAPQVIADNPAFVTGKKRFWLTVEEGSYDAAGKWKIVRLWNGDQTDYGINLKADEDVLLKVRLTTY